MCVLNWCYKHFRKPHSKTCTDHPSNFDESLILCENLNTSVDKCICKGLSTQRVPMLTNETVNVCYYPCRPSSTSSDAKVDKSIVMSKTTTSFCPGTHQSETECECTTEDSESSDEDYEIQFSEDEDKDEKNSSENFVDYEENQGEEQSEYSVLNANGSSDNRQNNVESNHNERRSSQVSEGYNMSKKSETSTRE